MNLDQIYKQAGELDIEIVYLKNYKEPGRLIEAKGQRFIFLNSDLSEVEKVNIILHEIAHLKADDLNNVLAQIPTYAHRIETEAEKDRIVNFLNLINEEYPIDENFNYVDYMTTANVPSQYENLVKETAKKLYRKNTIDRK